MANECLVTKLKGTVQNDNLPVLNQLSFNLSVPIGEIGGIYIGVAPGASMNLLSTIPLHKGSPSGTEVTQDVITGTTLYYYNGGISGSCKVYGDDFYKLRLVAIPGPYAQNSGIESLKYAAIDGISLEGRKDLCFSINGIKEVGIKGEDVDDVEIPQTLEILRVAMTIDNVTWYGINNNNHILGSNTSIKGIEGRFLGTVDDFPVNLMCIYSSTSGTTGDIADYITRVKAAGRTSGDLCIIPGVSQFMYNGTLISELATAGTIPTCHTTQYNMSCYCVHWEGNTITWLSSLPQDVDLIATKVQTPAAW